MKSWIATGIAALCLAAATIYVMWLYGEQRYKEGQINALYLKFDYKPITDENGELDFVRIDHDGD